MTANEIRKRLKGILDQYPAEHHKELGKLIFDLRDEITASKAETEEATKAFERMLKQCEEANLDRDKKATEIQELNSKLQAAQSFKCKAVEAEKALTKASKVLQHSIPMIIDLKKFDKEFCDTIFDALGRNNDVLFNSLQTTLVSIFRLFGDEKYVQRVENATTKELTSLLHIGFSEFQFLRTFTGQQFSRIPIKVIAAENKEGVI